MQSDVRIRDARADERPIIRDITLAAYSGYAEIMEPSAWALLRDAVVSGLEADDKAQRIVAVNAEDEVVGSVMLYPPASEAYSFADATLPWPELRLLAVPAHQRGRGIGEALVAECVRRAREMGATELGLHTSRSMTTARRMYQRLGFLRVPERDFQPPGAELVEGYRLPLG